MLNKIKQKIDLRIIPAVAAWFIFIRTTWPLFVISMYNHSNADDFWMSNDVHRVWKTTHSLFETLIQAVKSAVYLWRYWDGCFLSMLIGGVPPLVFNEGYYKITFSVLAGSVIIAVAAMLYVLLVRVLKFSRWHFALICPVVLTMFMNMTSSIKDMYYWWVGGINYTLFFAVMVFAQALLIEYMVSRRTGFLIWGSVFSFCVGLGNLLSGLANPVILLVECAGFIYFNRNDKKSRGGKLYIIPAVCGILGLLGNVLAPGNLIRGGNGLFGQSSVIGSVWGTIVASTNFIPEFYTPGMICMFAFITIVLLDGFLKSNISFKFKYPFFVIVLMYLVYCSAFTPVIYVGNAFYGRCKNVSFGLFIFFVLLTLIYITGWIKNRLPENIPVLKKISVPAIYAGMIAVMVACIAFKNYFDYAYAEVSLAQGQAQEFDAKVDARFIIYEDDSVKDVVVEEITWIPTVFYWDESCLDTLKEYYNKNSITLIEKE